MEINDTFWDHLEELRLILIRSLVVIALGVLGSLCFYQNIFQLLTLPLEPHYKQLVVLGPIDGIMTTIKTSFWIGLVGTSPFWVYQILKFVAPALNQKERSVLVPFLALSFLFLGFGFLFAFYVTIPLANQYLLAFNQEIGINLWSLSNYLDYTVILLLGHSLAFEISVVLLMLVHYGILKSELMKTMRPHMFVGAFVLSAILTPPDILTQILLAIPLICLYELAILYSRIRSK